MVDRRRLLAGGILWCALVSCEAHDALAPKPASSRAWSLAPATGISIVDVGGLGASLSTGALGVNDSGAVVGVSVVVVQNASEIHAFLLAHGVMTDLAPASGYSQANAINAAGDIAGELQVPGSSYYHAVLWRGGAVQDLGTLGGTTSSASGLNRSDAVVGWSYTAQGAQHAFAYENGSMRDLGTLGGSFSAASAVNEVGDVVGGAEDAQGAVHAVEWHQNSIRDLGTLPGDIESRATDINSEGDVVGISVGADGLAHAVLWHNGQIGELTPYSTHTLEAAFGINDSGQIVGYSNGPSYTPVLWQNGVPSALGLPSGANWAQPLRINNQGLVAGYASMTNAPPYSEGIVWVLPGTAPVRGGGRSPVFPQGPAGGPAPRSAAATNGNTRFQNVCNFNDTPVGYWEVGYYFDAFRCPVPTFSLNPWAPNTWELRNLAQTRVGDWIQVCGYLVNGESGVIATPIADLVNGRDNASFVSHTPGQVWKVYDPPNPIPSSLRPQLNIVNNACTSYRGVFDWQSAGGPQWIIRVQ